MNIAGPRPIPNKTHTAVERALEVIVSRPRISHTKRPIGTESKRIPIGIVTKFSICSSELIPFAIKIPAVIMMKGMINELRPSGLHECFAVHSSASNELGVLFCQVFVAGSYRGAPLTALPAQPRIMPTSNSFLWPERRMTYESRPMAKTCNLYPPNSMKSGTSNLPVITRAIITTFASNAARVAFHLSASSASSPISSKPRRARYKR